MEALIIDDSPANGFLAENFLLNSGFFETCTFRHASKIEEVKELIQGRLFQFIIIDPAFSREFGLPLIKTIKDYSPSTKTIALSLCSIKPCASECRQQCLDLGADCHLDKVKAIGLLPEVVMKYLGPDYFYNKTVPRKTFSSILRGEFSGNTRLKTPSFLRAKGFKDSSRQSGHVAASGMTPVCTE